MEMDVVESSAVILEFKLHRLLGPSLMSALCRRLEDIEGVREVSLAHTNIRMPPDKIHVTAHCGWYHRIRNLEKNVSEEIYGFTVGLPSPKLCPTR